MNTLRQAVDAARQQYQISPVQPIAKPVERVPLTTSILLCNGVEAVISGHSTCDSTRYQVSYFNRQIWQVQHRWVSRGAFEVIQAKTLASSVEVSVS